MKKWILYSMMLFLFNGLVCAQQTSYLNHAFSYHAPYDYLATQSKNIYITDTANSNIGLILGAYIYNSQNFHVFLEEYDINNGILINDTNSFLLDSLGTIVKFPMGTNYVNINQQHYLMMMMIDQITYEKSTVLLKLDLENKKYSYLGNALNSNSAIGISMLKSHQGNNLIVMGQDFEFNGYTPNFIGRIFISKLDSLGNIISTLYSNYEAGKNILPSGFIEVNNGYIISGYRQSNKFLSDPINEYSLPGVAVLLRNNGTQKVLKIGNEKVFNDLPLGLMVKKNDSEILVRTLRMTKLERGAPTKDAIMCIDTALNIKWIQNLDSTEQYLKTSGYITKTQDANYVINGLELNNELNEQIGEIYMHYFSKNYLQKIDSTGKFIWKRNIVYNEYFSFLTLGDITELANGDLLMTGMLMDQFGIVETPLQKMWVVRTDKYGCLVPGCEMYDDIDEKEANKIQLSLYPNPVINELYVYNPTHAHNFNAQLINLNGQVVKSNIYLSPQSTTIIPLDVINPGMYILKCSDENGGVQTYKIIKK